MRIVSLVIWFVVALAVLATAFITNRRGHRFSDVIAAIRSRPVGAASLGLGWAWVGWHFLVR
ncbi:MAG: hypothetical protein ACYCWN_02725 [Ferrimicrobium sp.]|jgi:hypothetical protein|uniref:Uncharacterized protein n=1 Tax=Ferrimicrobium acidiphilum TaxID=121039 RepID=A0ABV3Y0K2_9ACTN|nr:hypothetical protein [Ferrimicrobium sp.]